MEKLSVYNVCGFYTEEFYAIIPTFFFGFLLFYYACQIFDALYFFLSLVYSYSW